MQGYSRLRQQRHNREQAGILTQKGRRPDGYHQKRRLFFNGKTDFCKKTQNFQTKMGEYTQNYYTIDIKVRQRRHDSEG